jgi:hypothetical protein
MCGGTVFMRMGAPMTICTTLRHEGRINSVYGGPKMLKHMSNHGIVLDQELITLDLAGCVAIADVPCELH